MIFDRKTDKQTPRLDRRRSLAGIPVLNENVTLTDSEDGKVLVTLRIERGNGFWARFQPRVMRRSTRLDDLGSFVIRQIDGRRTVADIIDIGLGL